MKHIFTYTYLYTYIYIQTIDSYVFIYIYTDTCYRVFKAHKHNIEVPTALPSTCLPILQDLCSHCGILGFCWTSQQHIGRGSPCLWMRLGVHLAIHGIPAGSNQCMADSQE